jgi:hypothetical protein
MRGAVCLDQPLIGPGHEAVPVAFAFFGLEACAFGGLLGGDATLDGVVRGDAVAPSISQKRWGRRCSSVYDPAVGPARPAAGVDVCALGGGVTPESPRGVRIVCAGGVGALPAVEPRVATDVAISLDLPLPAAALVHPSSSMASEKVWSSRVSSTPAASVAAACRRPFRLRGHRVQDPCRARNQRPRDPVPAVTSRNRRAAG